MNTSSKESEMPQQDGHSQQGTSNDIVSSQTSNTSHINLDDVIRRSEFKEDTTFNTDSIIRQETGEGLRYYQSSYEMSSVPTRTPAYDSYNTTFTTPEIIENTRHQIETEGHRQLQKYIDIDNDSIIRQRVNQNVDYQSDPMYVDMSLGMSSQSMDTKNNFSQHTQHTQHTSNTTISQQQHHSATVMALFVGILTAVGGFLYGYDTGVINGLFEMGYVKRTYTDGNGFSASQQSVATSMLSVGTCLGSLFAPLFSDRIGRRMSVILFSSIIFSIGTIIQLVSVSVPYLCVGRLVSGTAVGVISAVIPLYQAEASPKWIRGSVISLYQWAITWGFLVSSGITQVTHKIDDSRCFRFPIGVQLIWGALLSVGMYLLPESPRFYVKKDNLDDAIISLSRFRRLPPDNESLIEELIEIKAAHDYEMSFGPTTILDCFRNSPSRICQRKRMFTGILCQALQQASGINFIFYYGVNFFVKTGLNNSYMISFITYAVNVVFTIPGIIFVDLWGRRNLFIIGALGMCVSNFIIAAVGTTTDSVIANKVMIAFVCLFIAFFASTWGPLAWVLVGELYGLSVRQKAVSLTASTNWLVNFIFAFATPYLVDTGNHTLQLGAKIFFVWGALNFAQFVFAYFFIYETKGLMLEEIDELYKVCPNAMQSSKFKSRLGEGILAFPEDDSKDTQKSITDQSANIGSDSTAVASSMPGFHPGFIHPVLSPDAVGI
ncbi:unnamed protein product [Ambrosiozyma monospora]|uniref:Unnamed protein product n=1 Tax=Ambrosiozyma monospora TaxID=43982 RepID=A0ACB5T5G9_AMBMO|nr:unnamed protein product [Ambrosiozyma monospora]